MIITVTNPINNEQVEIDAQITVNITVTHEGKTMLSVSASGVTEVVNDN
jgi:hypothetical protein